jgi:hypothetical protein
MQRLHCCCQPGVTPVGIRAAVQHAGHSPRTQALLFGRVSRLALRPQGQHGPAAAAHTHVGEAAVRRDGSNAMVAAPCQAQPLFATHLQ